MFLTKIPSTCDFAEFVFALMYEKPKAKLRERFRFARKLTGGAKAAPPYKVADE